LGKKLSDQKSFECLVLKRDAQAQLR
jgi:hypothetical protein